MYLQEEFMYKNYIFDLYGTLIDINTNEWNANLWKKMQEFYAFHGAVYKTVDLKREYFRICEEEEKKMSDKYDYPEIKVQNVFMKLFQNKGIDIDMNTCIVAGQFFRIISTKYIRLYDGVVEMLELLKKNNKKKYLLSNAQQIISEYEMKYLDIYKYFDGIVFSSDEECRKPSKTFYNIVLNRYNLKKEESVMIGNDWISDIEGAKKAGLDSVYLHTNISPRETIIENVQAKYIIKDGNIESIRKIIA